MGAVLTYASEGHWCYFFFSLLGIVLATLVHISSMIDYCVARGKQKREIACRIVLSILQLDYKLETREEEKRSAPAVRILLESYPSLFIALYSFFNEEKIGLPVLISLIISIITLCFTAARSASGDQNIPFFFRVLWSLSFLSRVFAVVLFSMLNLSLIHI
eukprot:TRINITY_DN12697_c0_g1_i4.p1 TRINITY_DN12697_c0_g1~~TRINITY_DN12697_c0_g1_i4.p1  ORF type:complete len:161 (-),score=30.30 TRINITY_DN12697_c0_g1_i4:61-543(-)